MNLTTKQIDALRILNHEVSIKVGSSRINNKIMFTLYLRKLVNYSNLETREYWVLTDEGRKEINSNNINK